MYAQQNGESVTEASPAEPTHEKGQLLREAESLVLTRGGVVARLAGIHGPGRSAILTRFLGGEAVLDPENNRMMNHIHRDDAAAALVLLAGTPARPDAIYNVVDDSPILRSECYDWLAKRLGRPAQAKGNIAVGGKRGRSSKRVSNAKLRGCGWAPRYSSFAVAMEQSICQASAFNLSVKEAVFHRYRSCFSCENAEHSS